ncbi:DNA polymerase III subunit delta' [[Clostridium] polysaccharolyticum]|jgi:DNA polymerase-3 subunit delta'|uniref:DNA polymerase-3 subunit delta n=1 Tax=[Clostridium] polysaccharolyticum TaxID=29364 RepID=A0A1I0FNF2_9FIRM|nr:DNA polymerase III subunit delta' [[Clostridium] polysaccharolyticum]SET59869.1 DNA polymerase-3 subunit delta' [[Clostridium] polysaccharolyticum]
MKKFEDVIGHEQVIEHMQMAIEKDRISHAYILNGENGSGKKMLADIFAAALQCEEHEKNPCGKCKSCLQAGSGNHPDIIKVLHEKASISVEDIRTQLNADIEIKPYSSKYKIYIVADADKMTEQAQNALLKTIEEPPAYGIIMLLATNKNKLLPTILSRCVTLDLKPVSTELIRDYLMKEYQVPDYNAELSARFSQGNLGKAVRYSTSEEFNESKDKILHLLKYVESMQVYEILEGVKQLGEHKMDIYDYIDIMMLWYRDILLYKASGNPNQLLFRSEYPYIKRQAEKIGYDGIEKVLRAMDKAKERLRANVNFDIAMELMLLVIKENGND